jgi:hypothetical protein
MKMITLVKFAGKAPLLGKEREVEFDGGKLTLSGLSVGEAEQVLERLGGGADKPATASAPVAANGVSKPAAPAAAPAAKPAAPAGPVGGVMVGGKAATANSAPTTRAPMPAKTPAPAAAAPAKVKLAPPPAPEPEEEEETAEDDGVEAADTDVEGGGDAQIPDATLAEMKKATKIKDVLMPMIELGINTTKGLVEKCEELKTEIPVLSRIPDLADRVSRAAEVLGVEAN